MYVLHMTAPWIGIDVALDLMHRNTPRYSDQETFQLVITFDRLLDICRGSAASRACVPHAAEVFDRVRERDPRAVFTEIVSTRGRREAEAALNTWRTVQMLLETPEEVRALRDDEYRSWVR
jgi:hypothetical protein